MSFGKLLTAMVTPFQENMEVDYDKAQELARYLISHGSDGIVVAGTTGESPTLTLKEKMELAHVVKEAVGSQAAVIAGTGSNSTSDSIKMTKAACGLSIDGVMLVTPYYNKPSQEGLYQHFKAVAQESSVPVLLYNIPGRTGCNLLPDTIARLSEIEQIMGVKEASGNLEQVSQLKSKTPKDFAIYSGDDALTLPILALGGCGVVSVASHIAGMEIKKMIEAYEAGRGKEAWTIHTKLSPLFKSLFITTNPVPVKYALLRMGIDTGGVRLPLVEAEEKEKIAIEWALTDFGI